MSVEGIVLAVDPGRTGAATAIATKRGSKGRGIVLERVEWRTVRRSHRDCFEVEGKIIQSANGLVGWLLADFIGGKYRIDAIGVEGMVIPNTKKGKTSHKGAKSIITLIEETGAIVDGFKAHGTAVGYRPTAVVWRGRVLKLGAYTKRERAEAYALECVDRLFMKGHGLDTIHLVEAGCIGLYCREALLTGDL